MRSQRHIEGPTVILRNVRPDDIEVLFAWINNRELVEFNAPYRPISEAEHREWFDGILQGQSDRAFFMIDERSSHRIIGSCQLLNINHSTRSCELQIRLGGAEFFGHGFGTEAVGLLSRYAFDHVKLERIHLQVFAFNERAIQSYRKVGFLEEGVEAAAAMINGEYVDVIRMGLRKNDE